MCVALKIAVSELASPGGDVYIRPLVAQAPGWLDGFKTLWFVMSRRVDRFIALPPEWRNW